MIRFFRSSFLVQYLALFFLAFGLWMPAFLNPQPAPPAFNSEPIFRLLAAPLASFPLISLLFAFVLMLFSGYVFNSMLCLHGLIPRTSVFGLFFWVLASGSVPATMSFQPLWPAMLFLLFSLNLAFSMYEQESNSFKLFNFGIMISISGLTNASAWILLLWVFAVLLVLRVSRLREWMIPMLGFFIPLLYLLVFWFLQNKLFTNLPRFLLAFCEGISVPQVPSALQIIILAFLILMVINALSFNYSKLADRNIAVRKRKAMLNALLFIALGALFLRNGSLESNAFFIIPFSAHLAIWAGGLNRTFRASVVIWLYILLALAGNIYYIFSNAQSALQ